MWGTLVHHITRIDPSDTPGSSIVYLLWKDGQESKHMMSIAQEKCPHLLVEYYKAYKRYKMKKMYKSIPSHILDLESWEDLVLKVCDVSKDEQVLVQWLDDSLSLHDLSVCEEKCPKKLISYFEWFHSTSEAAAIFSQGNRAQNTFMQWDEIESDPEAEEIEKLMMKFGEDEMEDEELAEDLPVLVSPTTARKRTRNPDLGQPKSRKEEKFGKLEKYLEIIHTTPRKLEKAVYPVPDSRAPKIRAPRSGAMRSRRPKYIPNPNTEIVILDSETPKRVDSPEIVDLDSEPDTTPFQSPFEKYTINSLEQSPAVVLKPVEHTPSVGPTPAVTPGSTTKNVNLFSFKIPKDTIDSSPSNTESTKTLATDLTDGMQVDQTTALQPRKENQESSDELSHVKDRIQNILSKLKTPLPKVAKKQEKILTENEFQLKVQNILKAVVPKG